MKRVVIVLVLLSVTGTGCQSANGGNAPTSGPPEPPAGGATQVSPAPTASPASPGGVAPSFPTRFEATVAVIDQKIRARMTYSWRPGCPVPIGDLRLLTLSYWGFDHSAHRGELVVHREVAKDLLRVFADLFRARFPIQRMVLVDVYQGSDDRSMAANNTSAFNCRPVTGGTEFSEHSYGRAIDINPLLNPYVAADGAVLPPAGARFADRSLDVPGMIHAGDGVVRAFALIGWTWGGAWSSIKDYQHFSETGR